MLLVRKQESGQRDGRSKRHAEILINDYPKPGTCGWLTPVILYTQEELIRRITVYSSQPRQIV
jgi:hypothetical protein